MAWAAIVAGKGGKRSQAAREVAQALVRRGLTVGGFAQRILEGANGTKTIEAESFRRPGVLVLARPPANAAEAASSGSACSLVFDAPGLAAARRWVEQDAAEADVLVLDGLGKSELAGQGNRAALDHAVAAAPLLVLAVRDDQLHYAVEALGLGEEPLACYTDGEGPGAFEAFVEAVAGAARAARR